MIILPTIRNIDRGERVFTNYIDKYNNDGIDYPMTLEQISKFEKLFKEIGPRVSARNGGYTRILKFGFRTGDKAPMAVMELVDRIVATEGQEKAAKKA